MNEQILKIEHYLKENGFKKCINSWISKDIDVKIRKNKLKTTIEIKYIVHPKIDSIVTLFLTEKFTIWKEYDLDKDYYNIFINALNDVNEKIKLLSQ